MTPHPTTPSPVTAHFCASCGTQLAGAGRFCPSCGQEVAPADVTPLDGPTSTATAAPAVTAPPPEPPTATMQVPLTTTATMPAPPAAPPADRRYLWAAIGGGVLLVGAIVAALLLVGGDDSSGGSKASYQRQMAQAFGPLLGANQQLSDELAKVRGTKPTDARVAARRAQEQATMTQGAIGALKVPEGGEQLSQSARQVLDRETAYVAAVAAVLNDPSNPQRSQLGTLESNLTSALSAAGPSIAGTTATVSGADRLAVWAPRASRTLRRRAAARHRAETDRNAARGGGSTTGSNGGSPSGSGALAGTRSCGGNLFAGPATSCEFAQNVRDAYNEAPGARATVRAHSPVTGQVYTMSCAPSGSGVTCSGGNDASVTFGG
jgi:hypothetical protein